MGEKTNGRGSDELILERSLESSVVLSNSQRSSVPRQKCLETEQKRSSFGVPAEEETLVFPVDLTFRFLSAKHIEISVSLTCLRDA